MKTQTHPTGAQPVQLQMDAVGRFFDGIIDGKKLRIDLATPTLGRDIREQIIAGKPPVMTATYVGTKTVEMYAVTINGLALATGHIDTPVPEPTK